MRASVAEQEQQSQDGGLHFDVNLHEVPLPRVRWCWDGPAYSFIAVEVACWASDPVIGVCWSLPTWLSTRLWDWLGYERRARRREARRG